MGGHSCLSIDQQLQYGAEEIGGLKNATFFWTPEAIILLWMGWFGPGMPTFASIARWKQGGAVCKGHTRVILDSCEIVSRKKIEASRFECQIT